MGDTPHKTEDGLPKVYASPRPHGTTTYFAGAGDSGVSGGVGAGDRLLFRMSPADSVKSVDMVFNEDVYIKDGYMITQSAPFGAYVDIHVVHPTVGVVGSFGEKIPLLGSGWFPLDTEDRSLLPAGMILRILVYNASDSDGVQEAAASFTMAGRIEMYRKNTT